MSQNFSPSERFFDFVEHQSTPNLIKASPIILQKKSINKLNMNSSLFLKVSIAVFSIFMMGSLVAQTGPSQDFDGDGIINSIDIDDDNDGVLDAMESPSCFYTATEARVISSVSTGMTIATGSTPLLYNGVTTTASPNFAFTGSQSVASGTNIFTVSYPTPVALSALNIINPTSFGTTSAGKLQGSNDSSSWTDLNTASAMTTANKVMSVTQNAGEYKYYRVISTAAFTTPAAVVPVYELTPVYAASPASSASAHPKPSCTGNDYDGDGIPKSI